MALFDIFKKKGPPHEEKLDVVYRAFKPEAVDMVFPGGKQQASRIVCSLAKILNINLASCDAKEYFNILSLFTDVQIRHMALQCTDSHIMTSLQVKHSDLVKDKETARKVMVFSKLNMRDNSYSLDSENDFSKLGLMVSILIENEKTAALNTEAETKHLNDIDYGLIVSKPIFTEGISGSNRYLAALRTNQGKELVWTRRGSTDAPGISGSIDIYIGKLPSGENYQTLYLCPYATSTSTAIPDGFIKAPRPH